MMKKLTGILLIVMTAHAITIKAQNLTYPGRIGWLGVYGKYGSTGLAVDSVDRRLRTKAYPITNGDTLVSVNMIKIEGINDLRRAMHNVRENQPVSLVIIRNGKSTRHTLAVSPLPMLVDDEMDITYGWVPFGNGQLRSVTYSPRSIARSIPYLLLIPGYNCSSIEGFYNSYNGKFIRQLVRAGIGVFTIEKSGIGDSYGCSPCENADLLTDIESFTAGFRQMASHPQAAPGRLYIFGHSMGGIIAPVVANNVRHEKPATGIVVFGTVFRPWFEFLPEMHRVQLPLEGKTYEETEHFVRGMQQVYYEFFVNKKSPAEISQIPALHSLAISDLDYRPGSTLMWGRHWKFWQQLDSLNLAKEWSATNSPVLSIFGGADYIACSELEHHLLAKTVNRAHPGNATHITIPDIDHIMVRHKDQTSSMQHITDAAYMRAHFHEGLGEVLVKWIKGENVRSAGN